MHIEGIGLRSYLLRHWTVNGAEGQDSCGESSLPEDVDVLFFGEEFRTNPSPSVHCWPSS